MKMVAFVIFVFVSHHACASDGVFEINQACATAGCFSGDAAGLPVTISQPGSYRLTSNLSAPATHGIQINTDGVQFDLGGFTISGPVVCTGSPISCVPSSYGPAGVLIAGSTNGVVVRNGRVQGFGPGVYSGRAGVVENIIAIRNAATGIVAVDGTLIRNSSALYNGTTGMGIGLGAQVVDSVANFNGQFGIAIGREGNNAGSVIRNTSVFLNEGTGIYDEGRSIIDGCVINGNSGIGLQIVNGGSQVSNTIVTNNANGIKVDAGTAFEAGGVRSSFSGNTLTGNNGGSANAQLTGAGLKVFLSPSLCGTATCS